MMIRFTQRIVEEAKSEGNVRIELWDTDAKGLGLRVSPTGKKVYCFKYFYNGQSYRPTIGEHPTTTLEAARGQALRWRSDLLEGMPPHLSRVGPKDTIRFSEFSELFVTRFVNLKLRKSSAEGYLSCIKRVLLPAFGGEMVHDITPEMVEALHANMDRTPRMANLSLSVLSKMMVTAIRWGYRARQDNPASFVTRYEEGKRDRYLSDGEIKRLLDYLAQAEEEGFESPWVCGAIKLALFTGMRRSELLTLTWSVVDMEEGVIHLQVHKTSRKAGARTIPLSPEALKVLQDLPKVKGNPRVFPGFRTDTTASVPEAWLRIRKEVGIDDVHFHDLRHTFATVASSAGREGRSIGSTMGHADSGSYARYQHTTSEAMKGVVNSVGRRIARLQKKGA